MKEKSFFRSLSKKNRFVMTNVYYLYVVVGISSILIGAVLPMMSREYGLSYTENGWIVSAHSIGNIATGLVGGYLTALMGMKGSLIFLNIATYLGFSLALVTRNPLLLVVGFFLTGVGRRGVGNYNNLVTSRLAQGAAGPLNTLHIFFAIGATIAPFLVLFTTRGGGSWKTAVLIMIALGIISLIMNSFMDLDDLGTGAGGEENTSLDFLKERLFWLTAIFMLCYLAVETIVTGWLPTYFVDSGILGEEYAQLLNAGLWFAIFVGRLVAVRIARHWETQTMLLTMAGGVAVFYTILIFSKTFFFMVAASLGLGFSIAGVYATAVANAGTILSDYTVAIGFFTTIGGIGSVAMPAIVGAVAEGYGIRKGMATVLGAIALMVIFALWNRVRRPALIEDWNKRRNTLHGVKS